jgi:hypothetical protein
MNDKKRIEWMGALLGVMFFVLMIGRGGMEEIRDNLLWVALGAGAFVIVVIRGPPQSLPKEDAGVGGARGRRTLRSPARPCPDGASGFSANPWLLSPSKGGRPFN